MFDLNFIKTVLEILKWREAVPVEFANPHITVLAKRRNSERESTHRVLRISLLSDEEKMLRLYVNSAYPSYFGIQLRISSIVDRNYDRTCRE